MAGGAWRVLLHMARQPAFEVSVATATGLFITFYKMSQRSNIFVNDDGDMEENSVDPDLIELVAFIRTHYAPAKDFPDSTLQLKTSDISERIREVYPVDFSEKQLYHALKDAGFTLHLAGQLGMFWLLKEL